MRSCILSIIFWITLTTVSSYRLPTNLHPLHYKLEIFTYLGEPNNFNFDGKVWIEINCNLTTPNITLHAANLTIETKSVSVNDISTKKSIEVSKVETGNNDFLIISLAQPLQKDHKYQLVIRYKGELNDGLYGFYRTSYTEKNETRWLGATQFEAIHARKAFPCFDEPAMKATFQIILGRKEGYSSISNMPLIKSEPVKGKNGWFWDFFETSVPMSTYLVAFVVSDFEFKEADPSELNNVTFKIWSRKSALNQVEFARQVGPKMLEFYESFFGIPYPLPKQDMIAIPDFSAGAMENWGLITYRETALLYDPAVSSLSSQYSIASVIAHELAHQWFGNLVTMKWWTDLWLNEGFATYMAGVTVQHLFPQWNSQLEEVVNPFLDVFGLDSLKSSHAVSVPIGHPSQIDEIFDTISYKKGSYLIRMMGKFLGEETLKKGLTNYLKSHAFDNAEQDDLWRALSEAGHNNGELPLNLEVKTIMDTWTLQPGFPVITVNRTYNNKNTAQVSQKRFLKDLEVKIGDECWWVPLTFRSESDANYESSKPKSWLSCPKQVQTITSMPGDESWVIFNVDVIGLFKVNYDENNWKLLIEALKCKPNAIPVLNKVQLIVDSYDLSSLGMLDFDIFFDLLNYLENEPSYWPWKATLSVLQGIKKHLKRDSSFGDFELYIRDLLTSKYEKFKGFNLLAPTSNDLSLVKYKMMILSWSCQFEVEDCVSTTRKLFSSWMKNPESGNPISKDIQGLVYCNAIRFGGEQEWQFLWQQYKKSNVATEKSGILGALACSREPWMLKRFLEWSLKKDSGIRKQDAYSVFSSIVSNNVGFEIAKNFLYNNIAEINTYMTNRSRILGRYLLSISGQIVTEKDAKEYEEFLKINANYLTDIRQSVEQSQEFVKLNLQWRRLNLNKIKNIFSNYTQERNERNDRTEKFIFLGT